MYFLWIDPGIRKLWYALIDHDMTVIEAGVLLQDEKELTREKQFVRMEKIYTFFVSMLQQYTLESIAMEKLYFTDRNMNNAEFVYGIRGALAMLFSTHHIPLYEYTPNELKKRITGTGTASKELMMQVTTRLFSLENAPKRHDTSDALGLARLALQKTDCS